MRMGGAVVVRGSAALLLYHGHELASVAVEQMIGDEKERATSENEAQEKEGEGEEDFMSDSFIQQASEYDDTASKTKRANAVYSDVRRKRIDASREKGQTVSRLERERQARRAGLARSLLGSGDDERKRIVKRKEQPTETAGAERASSTQEGSKALRMMVAMGFKPGTSLGNGDGGGGSSQGEADAKKRAEPLAIDERWLGYGQRAGIGRLPRSSAAALSDDIRSAYRLASDAQRSTDEANFEQFRSRARQAHDQRHAEALLSTARKTCVSLDKDRLDMSYSPLWLTSDMLHRRTDDLEKHERDLVEFALEGLDALLEMETSAKSQRGNDGDGGGGGADVGDESTSKDSGDVIVQRAREARQFCQLPTQARLDVTLSHLRRAHSYCLFCGQAYDDAEQLATLCPGEQEDDH